MRRTPFQRRNATPAFVERPDGELLSCFLANRDEVAFAALVERYEPMVLRVCLRVLHHRQDAEDAAQKTFLVLWEDAESIRKRESVGSWLHGVAYHIAKDIRRSKRRHESHKDSCEITQITQIGDGAESDAESKEKRALVVAEAQRLPEKYRLLVVLCYWEGKSKGEIAAEVSLPEGTVSGRLARARQLLKRRLAHRGITCPTA